MSRISRALVGLSLTLVAGALVVSACSSNTAPAGNTITVPSGALQYSPTSLTIAPGDAVRFTWSTGAITHNVTPASGNPTALPSSSAGAPPLPLVASADFSITFPTAGVFRFYCGQHGANPTPTTVTGMSGTITVQ
jgi:plastocyanin